MKLRRTRIKKITKANGSVEYAAQYKYGLWWCYFYEDGFISCDDARCIFKCWPSFGEYSSKERAQNLIDFYVKHVNYQNVVDMGNKADSTEYEEYP